MKKNAKVTRGTITPAHDRNEHRTPETDPAGGQFSAVNSHSAFHEEVLLRSGIRKGDFPHQEARERIRASAGASLRQEPGTEAHQRVSRRNRTQGTDLLEHEFHPATNVTDSLTLLSLPRIRSSNNASARVSTDRLFRAGLRSRRAMRRQSPPSSPAGAPAQGRPRTVIGLLARAAQHEEEGGAFEAASNFSNGYRVHREHKPRPERQRNRAAQFLGRGDYDCRQSQR